MDADAPAPLPDVELTPLTAGPVKPRVWTVFLAVFLAVVAAVVLQIVLVAVLVGLEVARGGDVRKIAEELPPKLYTPGMFMLVASFGQLAFALAAFIPAWLSPVPLRERLGLLPARASWLVYPLTTVGSWAPLALGIAFFQALALVVPPDPMVEQLFENITLAYAVPFVLFIAIVPGIVEELLFRGYVQRRLLERWRPAWAIVVTSLLFALVHVQPHHVVAALPLGLWFGVIAWRTGSVFPTILCHAFVNGSLNAWRMVVKFGEVPETTQSAVHVGALLVGLICFVLSVNCLIGEGNAPTAEPVNN